MAFSPRELRAIQYVADKNHWKLTLCSWPTVVFVGPDGGTIKHPIKDVLAEYDQGRRADKVQEKRSAPLTTRRRFS